VFHCREWVFVSIIGNCLPLIFEHSLIRWRWALLNCRPERQIVVDVACVNLELFGLVRWHITWADILLLLRRSIHALSWRVNCVVILPDCINSVHIGIWYNIVTCSRWYCISRPICLTRIHIRVLFHDPLKACHILFIRILVIGQILELNVVTVEILDDRSLRVLTARNLRSIEPTWVCLHDVVHIVEVLAVCSQSLVAMVLWPNFRTCVCRGQVDTIIERFKPHPSSLLLLLEVGPICIGRAELDSVLHVGVRLEVVGLHWRNPGQLSWVLGITVCIQAWVSNTRTKWNCSTRASLDVWTLHSGRIVLAIDVH